LAVYSIKIVSVLSWKYGQLFIHRCLDMMFCMSKNIPQAPMPRAIDTIREKEAFKHKAVTSSKKAVAGNPHNTPNRNLHKYGVVSP
jgi:hypothetical protein